MADRPEIDGRKACVHGRYYDVCKQQPCKDMYVNWLIVNHKNCAHGRQYEVCQEHACKGIYAKWLVKKKMRHGDYERLIEENPDADAIDAIIYFLQKNGGQTQHVEMKNDISTLVEMKNDISTISTIVARMRDLYS